MMNRKTAAAAAGAVLFGGVLTAPATPAIAAPKGGAAIAASCYGSAYSLYKPPGTEYDPTGFYVTTSNCRDIQIKPEFTVLVKVCFKSTGCQRGNTFAAFGKWTVVATNVNDGVPFRFQFTDSDALHYSGAF